MTAATAKEPLAFATKKNKSVESILKKSVVLVMHRHWLGNNADIDLGEIVDESGGNLKADADQFSATKKLIDQKELRPVMRVLRMLRRTLREHAIPAGAFGNGAYLVAYDNVENIDAMLVELETELKVEARKLAHERYTQAVARQKIALKTHFDANDYKTPDEVEKSFSVDWNYISFDAPDRLEHVSRALFDRAKQRSEQRWASAYEEARLVLRASLRELVKQIVERLAPGEDGKPKRFHGSNLEHLAAFLESFKMRDLTDDSELGEVVTKLQRLTKGLDVKDLKTIDALREKVHGELKKTTKYLDGLVKTSRRSIGEL